MALASNNRDSSMLKKRKIAKVQSTEAVSYAFTYRR